jgi:hypothetical protein
MRLRASSRRVHWATRRIHPLASHPQSHDRDETLVGISAPPRQARAVARWKRWLVLVLRWLGSALHRDKLGRCDTSGDKINLPAA